MANVSLEVAHYYYGKELGVTEALNLTKANCCPVEHALDTSPSSLPGALLSIKRVACLIAKASFCSKHDAETCPSALNLRCDSIFRRARACPLFDDCSTVSKDYDFASVARRLKAFEPQKPPRPSKRTRGRTPRTSDVVGKDEREQEEEDQQLSPKRIRRQQNFPPTELDALQETNLFYTATQTDIKQPLFRPIGRQQKSSFVDPFLQTLLWPSPTSKTATPHDNVPGGERDAAQDYNAGGKADAALRLGCRRRTALRIDPVKHLTLSSFLYRTVLLTLSAASIWDTVHPSEKVEEEEEEEEEQTTTVEEDCEKWYQQYVETRTSS
ncbi:unnamed protein product [Zymoseptoria tritici ST99CH_3D1]|nr:unnamed protein product [Zymoseptoria tritici ST99CH_3D1]